MSKDDRAKRVPVEVLEPYTRPGRPSEYFPEFCEQLITHMSEGYSFESFGGRIRQGRSTLYKWLDEYPEFMDAKKEGEAASRLFWEELQIRNAKHGVGNFSAISWAMSNRFGQSSSKPTDTDAESAKTKPNTLKYDLTALKKARDERRGK